MGTSTDSKHARSTVAGDTRIEQSAPQESLSAGAFLERRMTSIEAEAAAKAGQPSFSPPTEAESLLKEALHVTNNHLRRMLTPRWLSESPMRAKIDETQLKEITASRPEEAERAQAALDQVVGGINRSLKQEEIRKMGFVLSVISKTECVRPNFKAIITLLKSLDMALLEGTPESINRAEKFLKRGHQLIASMAESITEALEAQSPEALEAKRLNRIHQAAQQQKEKYRNSDEYRSLKLLALVDKRLNGGEENTSAETKLAQKLSSKGFEGVVQMLLNYAPSLRIEESHLQALKELFEKIATSEHSTETADSVTQAIGVEQNSTTTNPHDSESRAAVPEASEMEPALDTNTTEEKPEVLEFKQELLQDLGIKDPTEREYLSRTLTLQNIEIAAETLTRLGTPLRVALLECNPKLLDPASGINLGTFCQEINDFITQAYDLHGVDEFNPFSTPTNFKDHAALKKTRKAAIAFRIERQLSEGSEGTRS